MPAKFEETKTSFRCQVHPPGIFDKYEKPRIKPVANGVKIISRRIENTARWEIESCIFDKTVFQTQQQVVAWLNRFLKSESQLLLGFRSFNEYRRRLLQAYLHISHISGEKEV
jgi:hypothetical protein